MYMARRFATYDGRYCMSQRRGVHISGRNHDRAILTHILNADCDIHLIGVEVSAMRVMSALRRLCPPLISI